MTCSFHIDDMDFSGDLVSSLPQRRVNGIFKSGEVKFLVSVKQEEIAKLVRINDSISDVLISFRTDEGKEYQDSGNINIGPVRGNMTDITLLPRNCWHLK